jgi:hypothetical protein
MTDEQAKQPTPIRDVKLRTGSFRLAEEAQNRFSAMLEASHTMEDVMNPGFWSINAKRIKQHNIIDIRTEDTRFYAECYVLKATPTGVVLRVLRHFDLQEGVAKGSEHDEYFHKWLGTSWQHCVVRKSDNSVMAKNLSSKGEAMAWIEEQHAQAA